MARWNSSTFNCKLCQRTLPEVMKSGGNRCTDCSDNADTDERFRQVRKQIDSAEKTNSGVPSPTRSPVNSDSSTEDTVSFPHVKEIKPEIIERDPSVSSGTHKKPSPSSTPQDTRRVEESPKAQLFIQPEVPSEYSEFKQANVFALGEYRVGENTGYSHKVLNVKDNNKSHRKLFLNQLQSFISTRCSSDIKIDYITVYPSSGGGYHDELEALAEIVTKERFMEYKPLLYRTKTPRSQKSLTDRNKKWKNQIGTIGVKSDVTGDTILILDDICTTGASLTVGTNQLLDEGADEVISVCLGISNTYTSTKRRKLWDEHHSVSEQIENEI